MTQPVVFSASSVNAYRECQLKWWFAYVLAIQKPPSEPQAVGITLHDYAERRLRGIAANGRTPVIAVSQHIAPLAKVFDADILPTYGKVLLIEEQFQIEVNGIPYSGTIDALDRHADERGFREEDAENEDPYGFDHNILRDLKTTSSRPSKGKYRLNMVGYFLGVTEGLGLPVHLMMLDYIVRTKTPYYWPEEQAIPDQDEIDRWAGVLERVAESVAQGRYEATGLGTAACNWCHFHAECGPYQRYTAISPLREQPKEYEPPS